LGQPQGYLWRCPIPRTGDQLGRCTWARRLDLPYFVDEDFDPTIDRAVPIHVHVSASEKVTDLVVVGRIDHAFKPLEQELPSVFGNPDCGKMGPCPTGLDFHSAIVSGEYPL
jgi:hypothetical protein